MPVRRIRHRLSARPASAPGHAHRRITGLRLRIRMAVEFQARRIGGDASSIDPRDRRNAHVMADASRVFLLGFSQAPRQLSICVHAGDLVRGVVAVCGGIPGDWETEGKYQSGVVDVLCVAASATSITRRTGCGGTPMPFAAAPDRSNCGFSTQRTRSRANLTM